MVDEGALVEALRERQIARASLDVHDPEPLALDHPLREIPDRVVLSLHTGDVSTEVYRDFYGETARSLVAYLPGEADPGPRDFSRQWVRRPETHSVDAQEHALCRPSPAKRKTRTLAHRTP
jgi:phosphoglycerate dehydrogenase-like enzyme